MPSFSSPPQPSCHALSATLSRRAFLRDLGVAAAGLTLAACAPVIRPPAARGGPVVAIAQASAYDPRLLRAQVQQLLERLGGVGDILAHGKRVAIKVNLTGGIQTPPLPGIAAIDSYMTHPAVVAALIELLRDAGASQLFIVEAVDGPATWAQYGYASMARATGATLVDLNQPAPYKAFINQPPGTNPLVYERYVFNPILLEVDAFITVSKLKCHYTAGVTHALKNQFGLVPTRFYTLNPGDNYRSALHGAAEQTRQRLPRIIADINRARPINLALIDGIQTVDGGEGPWIQGLRPIAPHLLIAGKDPVATDAVATAAMGFDPAADFPTAPFLRAENHLKLAAHMGLGVASLDAIQISGAALSDVAVPFRGPPA
jgi:uncharacterized protein (DUF362 family)